MNLIYSKPNHFTSTSSFQSIILTLLFLCLCSCSSKIIYCGPNKTHPVHIYKKPNNHFDQVSKDLTISLKGNLELIDKLSLSNIESGLKTDSKILAEELNNTSLRLNDIMYRAAEAYNFDPCPPENSKRFYDILDLATKELQNMATLESNLKNIVYSANINGIDENKLSNIIKEYREKVPNL